MFLHIIKKPNSINGDGYLVHILNVAVKTYNTNIHSKLNKIPVDASINPEKINYYS